MQIAALAVASGLLYGCTLLLVATGLTLIFGVGRVVNFAHGTLYALGAFLGASIHAVAGLWAACLAAPALVAAVAVLLDLLVIRRLRQRGEMAVLLFTFGLGIVIDAAITGIWGARSYAVPVPPLLAGGVPLFGGQLSTYSIALAAISLAASGGLLAVLHGTGLGLRLRAAAENPAMAEIAGRRRGPRLHRRAGGRLGLCRARRGAGAADDRRQQRDGPDGHRAWCSLS